MVIKMNYTLRMQEVRIMNNVSQLDVAQILNISKFTYSHYETQDAIIPLKHLLKFCNYFDISVDYILGFTNDLSYPKMIKNEDSVLIANNLKKFRKLSHITQNVLAKELNVNQSTISEYEKGNKLISTPNLYRLCKKYNISADYLLGKTDNPKYLK